MDDKRRLFKQIIIAAIYLVIFSGIGAGVYFLVRPTPTLPPPPAPTIYPIQIIWNQIFVTGPSVYSVAAKITNPNMDFGSNSFTYTFYLYDTNGALLLTKTEQSFIWPGESKYLIDAGIKLPKAPTKVDLALDKPSWREAKNFQGINLSIGNIVYGKGTAGSGKYYSVDAAAYNGTSYELDKVFISAVIFDKNNLPITVGSTLLENLKSKEQRPFSIPWFSAFSGVPDKVELNISTNLWERSELLGQ